MAKFKVGDKVRVIRDTECVKEGQTGTVREESYSPWIHFDTRTGYITPVNRLGIPAGYADCVAEYDLELITDPVDNSERDELAKQFMLQVYADFPSEPMGHSTYQDMCAEMADMAFDLADAYMAEKARRNNP